MGGQSGCEPRIEVFVKIQKKIGGGSGGQWEASGWGGVRVDVNEIEVFVKIQKKNFFFGGGGEGGGVGGGVGVGLGGQSGCERRIEVFVKIQKKNLRGGGRVGGSEWM